MKKSFSKLIKTPISMSIPLLAKRPGNADEMGSQQPASQSPLGKNEQLGLRWF
ncbi:MAG: hypothetical protein R2825_22255 [Saprospiraceae bacterium]